MPFFEKSDRWILLGILVVQCFVSIWLIFTWSAIWDEPGHLVAGQSHWRQQDFRLYAVNPPLARMWATLPVMLSAPYKVAGIRDDEVPAMRPEFPFGADYFDNHPELALRSLRIARLANLIWPLLGTILIFYVTTRCFGKQAGYTAALMWAFCPLVIGHGVLLPPDVAAAVMMIAVATMAASITPPFLIHRAAIVGIVLGLALLTKTTLLILCPIVVGWILLRWNLLERIQAAVIVQSIKEILVMTLLTWITVNVGYGWDGVGTRLGDFEFFSSSLSGTPEKIVQSGNVFRGTKLGSLPMPLPKNFILGIDVQYRDFEHNFFYPYMLGRWERDGFKTFYLWYFLLKLPLGFLVLIILGAVAIGLRLIEWKDSRLGGLVLTMGLAVFIFLSWRTDLNYCQRYAIICLPALCLLAGGASLLFKKVFEKSVFMTIVATTVGVGLWNFPHALSYYNGLVDGPRGGRYALHGNGTDWGQDAMRIGQWCQSYPDRRPLSIATVGYPSSLKAYGVKADSIRYEVDTPAELNDLVRGRMAPAEGWHIVSFVHLLDPRSPYHDLLHREPVESIGWTHRVYFFDKATAEELDSGRYRRLVDD